MVVPDQMRDEQYELGRRNKRGNQKNLSALYSNTMRYKRPGHYAVQTTGILWFSARRVSSKLVSNFFEIHRKADLRIICLEITKDILTILYPM